MKRVVVHLQAEFAYSFQEGSGTTFLDAVVAILKEAFGENSTKVIRQDEYNFELEVDEGFNDVKSNVLVQFITEKLGIGSLVGQAVFISCYAVKSMPSFFLKREKTAKFVDGLAKYKDFPAALSKVVKGQQYAINTVVKGFVEAASFPRERNKPALTFFFAGEEDTGKRLLATEACKYLGKPYVEFSALDYHTERVYEELFAFINANPTGAVIFNDVEEFSGALPAILYIAYTTGYAKGYSFRGLTIFFISKCGRSLYENSRPNLSHLSTQEIIEAVGREGNPNNGEPLINPLFLEAIRNERFVMFNHLQTVDYQNIISETIKEHIEGIKEKTGIYIDVNTDDFARFALYQNPDDKNVDRIVKNAKELINNEVQQLLLQNNSETGEPLLSTIQQVEFRIDYDNASKEVKELFQNREYKLVVVSNDEEALSPLERDGYKVTYAKNIKDVKKAFENDEADVVLLDPIYGLRGEEENIDYEDYDSVGMEIFNYLRSFRANTPLVLISNKEENRSAASYQTLINRGADKLTFYTKEDVSELLDDVCAYVMSFELDRDLKFLRKSNLQLGFNPRQNVEEDKVVVSFAKLTLRQVNVANFDVTEESNSLRIRGFDDVIGVDVAKEVLRNYSKYLSDTSEYLEKGGIPPRYFVLKTFALPQYGIFFTGGGKSTLVRAMVEETGASYQAIDAKEIAINRMNPIIELRNAFKKARLNSPSVLHLKNFNVLTPAEENPLTLNVLEVLKQESEYTSRDVAHPVIVIVEVDNHYSCNDELINMATRSFTLPRPLTNNVEEFIRRYFAEHHIDYLDDETIFSLAQRAVSLRSYREVAKLLNFIINLANGSKVTATHCAEGFDILQYGDTTAAKSSEHAVLTVSYHEIGHYVLMRLFGQHSPFVTINPRGVYGGYTAVEAREGLENEDRQDFLNEICIDLGGRAAEIFYNGEEKGITTGLGSDIKNATRTAKAMVTDYAMTEYFVYCDNTQEMALNGKELYDKVNQILLEQMDRAVRLLKLNAECVHTLAKALAEKRFMTGKELEALWPDDKLIHE